MMSNNKCVPDLHWTVTLVTVVHVYCNTILCFCVMIYLSSFLNNIDNNIYSNIVKHNTVIAYIKAITDYRKGSLNNVNIKTLNNAGTI